MLDDKRRLEGVRIARPPRATRRVVAAFVHWVVTACAGTQPIEPAPLVWSRDTLIASARLIRDYTDSTTTTDVIHRAFQIRATSGHWFVSDVGSDRVAVLDSFARVIRWIGTRGQGPGELRGASHLAVLDDRVFVAEALNGRVSEFTLAGHFVRAYRAPFASGSIAASHRALLAAVRSRIVFGGELMRGGEPQRALARVRRDDRAKRDRWTALPGHDLITTDDTGTWVFDQARGDVCFYAKPYSRAQCRSLPDVLLARLRAYRDARVSAFEAASKLRVEVAPLAKDMVQVGSSLALLLPLPEMPIALIDVNDGSLTPALTLFDTLPSWARSATSFTHDGRNFVIVGDDGIGYLRLSARRHSN